MLSRSATYNSIMSGWHSVEWKIVIDGTTYGMGDISADLGGGHSLPKLNRCLFTGSTPTIGGCCAATFECSIFEESANIPRMATVVPSYRITNGTQTSEWIQLGVFYIDTRSYDKVTGALSLYCYDAMLKADGINGQTYAELSSFDEWPQSMANVAADIASIIGVPIDNRTNFRYGDGYTVAYPNDLSMREVLGYIASAHCGNWCITPEGKLRLIPITGGSGSLNLGSNAVTVKHSGKLAAYTGVSVYYADESVYVAGTDYGMTIMGECPWATQNTADGMLRIIEGYQYQPYTIQGAFPDLALELGDSVTAGLPNDTVTGPCFSINITCEVLETAEISAPGEAEVDHEYPYVDYVDRKLKRRVGLGQPYEGVTISRQFGIQILGIDGQGNETNRALLNSHQFTMDVATEEGWEQQFYFDPERRAYVFKGALGADAIYADLGNIAELTVDRLSTSKRVRKYILSDTTDDNYIKIQDNYICLMTGTVVEVSGTPQKVQARNRNGDPLYWQSEPVSHNADGYPLDAEGKQIYSTTDETDWEVWVYQYIEQIKSEYSFQNVNGVYYPQLVMGAGDNQGNSKGYFWKETTDLLMEYVTSSGESVSVMLGDDGYVDINRLRRAKTMDFSNWDGGYFTETLDGDIECSYLVDFDGEGKPIKIYDGYHECEIIW